MKAGAMLTTKIKVSLKLDEKGQPIDCEPYNRTEANALVEEVGRLSSTRLMQTVHATSKHVCREGDCFWLARAVPFASSRGSY